MFKRFFILISIFFLSAFANAQIQRNFNGIVLGKATKKEIINNIYRKGICPDEECGGKYIVARDDISFGGVIWDAAAYELYNGTFFRIIYTKSGRSYSKDKELDEIYCKLRNNLLKKYTNKKIPSSNAVIPDNLYIKDKNTSVEIKRFYKNGWFYVKLIYTDILLSNKARKKDYNEL